VERGVTTTTTTTGDCIMPIGYTKGVLTYI